jgi:hypothetical protein
LTFRSQLDGVPGIDPLCEDRVVLFRASDEENAQRTALEYGQREETSYRNKSGQLVTWRFIGIDHLSDVGSKPTVGGWEVSARYFRPSDARQANETEDRFSAE